jgi:hypothetical protein
MTCLYDFLRRDLYLSMKTQTLGDILREQKVCTGLCMPMNIQPGETFSFELDMCRQAIRLALLPQSLRLNVTAWASSKCEVNFAFDAPLMSNCAVRGESNPNKSAFASSHGNQHRPGTCIPSTARATSKFSSQFCRADHHIV